MYYDQKSTAHPYIKLKKQLPVLDCVKLAGFNHFDTLFI